MVIKSQRTLVHGGRSVFLGQGCGSESPGNCFIFMLLLPGIAPSCTISLSVLFFTAAVLGGFGSGIIVGLIYMCVVCSWSCYMLHT